MPTGTAELFDFTPGTAPLLISIPHAGTDVPAEMRACFTPAGLALADTDWHLPRLYAGAAAALGIGVLAARQSRYVIDLNRDPEGLPLYPGADETELCPTTTFAQEPIYSGACPDAAEIARRSAAFWRPYHDALAAELARLKARHGRVVLWEAHSIRSRVPRLFDGRLPDLNLGTGGGTSAAPELAERLLATCRRFPAYGSVLDGRFKGGYITRHFGRPAEGVHAVQLEMVQATYMDEAPPFAWREDRAAPVRPLLHALLAEALAWAGEEG